MSVHSVRLPVQGLATLSLKISFVEVQASENCVALAIIIAIAKFNNDPDYKAYRQDGKIRPVVQKLLDKTGVVLCEGGGIPELLKFQEYFRQYKITVYLGLACEDIMFEGKADSPQKINLLYDNFE